MEFKVNIRCNTYNHSKFITAAMDGFTKQKTAFPFIAVIVDDASTDSSEVVIKDYFDNNFHRLAQEGWLEETEHARFFLGQHNVNENCFFLICFLKYNHYHAGKSKAPYFREIESSTEYSAFCEGDDYWTDPHKLQKQVDYLDANPEYTICFHAVRECFEGRPYLDRIRSTVEDREYSGIEWYRTRPSQFASLLIRSWIRNSDLYKEVIADRGFVATDVPLLLTCSHYGKMRGMSDVMSVYRHNETGWTQKKHSKASIIKIAESELHYSVFGEEFRAVGESFYCLALVRAFVNSFLAKSSSIDFEYLHLAWNKSKYKTVKSFGVLIVKYIRKYFKV